jgi:putative tryptophan/tyrosine transport system substrate-binding protein
MFNLGRRGFIALVGGAAAAWPLAARAQQSGKVARIGFLSGASPNAAGYPNRVAALRSGLRDHGYVEGANLVIEYRWAEENYARLPALAADLVRSNVDVIVTHGTPAALAAKRATATVPIVMAIIGDPTATGVVTSVARPGGNITGSSYFSPEVNAKRIELLKEAMPPTDENGCSLESGQSHANGCGIAGDADCCSVAQIAAEAVSGAGVE